MPKIQHDAKDNSPSIGCQGGRSRAPAAHAAWDAMGDRRVRFPAGDTIAIDGPCPGLARPTPG
jgi:hypothetical protein